jgi:hypothetical protein
MTVDIDPTHPDDPRRPCAICGSPDHTSGYHDGGVGPPDDPSGPEEGVYTIGTEEVLENRPPERG